MEDHLKLLGFKVRDIVTGFEGTVTHIGFDLYGCVQAIVHPGAAADGKLSDSAWFDLKRLSPISQAPVMQVPTFTAVPGGEEKPKFRSNPTK